VADPTLDPARDVVVIGCGNLLRGDDAVGPMLIRRLWEQGVPDDGVLLVDGGTAGMDVAFKMRGARKVVIVDASSTGAAPGTVYQVPADELESLPPLDGLHSHSFRWDHALSFGRWLLADDYPADITVFLIEAASVEFGAELTPAVAEAMELVAGRVRRVWEAERAAADPVPVQATRVEFTADGYLRLDAAVAAEHFPADALVAVPNGSELWLLPLIGSEGGGLLLKQRNARGDRAALVWEALPAERPVGVREAVWDDERGALRVDVRAGR
jgi:hydrogenase maturation protease